MLLEIVGGAVAVIAVAALLTLGGLGVDRAYWLLVRLGVRFRE